MKKHKAFSLVELLIVIAIVAILSAIAVPAYKKYMLRVKLAVGISLMDNAIGQAFTYAATHGNQMPNLVQLGYNVENPLTDPECTVAAFTDLPLGVNDFCIGPDALSAENWCKGVLEISLKENQSLPFAFLRCTIGHVNGVAMKFCQYAVNSDDKSVGDLSLPGWVSVYSNSTYGYDYYSNTWLPNHNLSNFDSCS